jgi:protein-S-isoprenylcysteine O-methyltransferase Ste14
LTKPSAGDSTLIAFADLAATAAPPTVRTSALPEQTRRLVIGLMIALLAVPGAASALADLRIMTEQTPSALALAALLGHLFSTLFLLGAAACTTLRFAPRRRTLGWRATSSALAGSFLLQGFSVLPQHDLPMALGLAAAALTGGGYLAALVSLCWLGRSFSILPAARRLVTGGPYAVVRHPLYLAEELAVVGLFIHCASLPALVLVIAHFAFQVVRMHYEERVLADAFVGYRIYAANTARLLPGVF